MARSPPAASCAAQSPASGLMSCGCRSWWRPTPSRTRRRSPTRSISCTVRRWLGARSNGTQQETAAGPDEDGRSRERGGPARSLPGTSTGISAADRAATCRALATPSAQAADFARPGHIFPLRYTEGGVLKRMGHTEASIGRAVGCVCAPGSPMLSPAGLRAPGFLASPPRPVQAGWTLPCGRAVRDCAGRRLDGPPRLFACFFTLPRPQDDHDRRHDSLPSRTQPVRFLILPSRWRAVA